MEDEPGETNGWIYRYTSAVSAEEAAIGDQTAVQVADEGTVQRSLLTSQAAKFKDFRLPPEARLGASGDWPQKVQVEVPIADMSEEDTTLSVKFLLLGVGVCRTSQGGTGRY